VENGSVVDTGHIFERYYVGACKVAVTVADNSHNNNWLTNSSVIFNPVVVDSIS